MFGKDKEKPKKKVGVKKSQAKSPPKKPSAPKPKLPAYGGMY